MTNRRRLDRVELTGLAQTKRKAAAAAIIAAAAPDAVSRSSWTYDETPVSDDEQQDNNASRTTQQLLTLAMTQQTQQTPQPQQPFGSNAAKAPRDILNPRRRTHAVLKFAELASFAGLENMKSPPAHVTDDLRARLRNGAATTAKETRWGEKNTPLIQSPVSPVRRYIPAAT